MNSTFRLKLAHSLEDQFYDFIIAFEGWKVLPFGHRFSDQNLHAQLVKITQSKLNQAEFSFLPWFNDYQVRMQELGGFPAFIRWDPDCLLLYQDKPVFFAEIKGGQNGYPNWAIEASGLIAATMNSKRLGIPQLMVFGSNANTWDALPLEALLHVPMRFYSGKNAAGSKTPFLTFSKTHVSSINPYLATYQP